MPEKDTFQDEAGWGSIKAKIQDDLEQYRREQNEISLMLEQSQVDVNKLAQRTALITTHLQQVQAQFESMPREDIRTAYDSALDAQQRLLVMRGQVDKLQSDQSHLQRTIDQLVQVIKYVESGMIQESGGAVSLPAQTVEMAILAQEAERQRLSRQMHDGPAQALSNFILQSEISMRLFETDPAKAKEELENLKTAATSTFRKVRDFIFELRPMMLDDLGLVPTLKRYVEAIKSQTNGNILLSITGSEKRLVSYLEVMIFRSIQDLVGYAVRHSQAGKLKIQLDIAETIIRVAVEDDGKGYELNALPDDVGAGLRQIRDRVEMLGGEFFLDSIPGQGTRISYHVPSISE